MKHCGTQRIETNRLILREFFVDDAEAMYRNWASDPEVVKYLT
jgi:ribosomal-protein-alanine N-acetyltransferase